MTLRGKGLTYQARLASQVIMNSTRQWSAYRSNIVTVALVAPIQMLAQYFIWKAVLSVKGSINGMKLGQMLTYYAVATILQMFLSDDMGSTLRQMIASGDLSATLIKPLNFFYYSFLQKIGSKILSTVVEVLPLSLIFVILFHINLAPRNIPWAAASILLSFIHIFLLNYCIGMTAFWFVNNWGIYTAVQVLIGITSGLLVPLSFFPGIIQQILFFMPFQFMYYIPTQVILGSYHLAGLSLSPFPIVMIQLAYVVMMWVLTSLIWKIGIRKYTGVGI